MQFPRVPLGAKKPNVCSPRIMNRTMRRGFESKAETTTPAEEDSGIGAVAAIKTEYNPSEREVTRQLLKMAAPSKDRGALAQDRLLVPKGEETCQELNDVAFLAVKEEPADSTDAGGSTEVDPLLFASEEEVTPVTDTGGSTEVDRKSSASEEDDMKFPRHVPLTFVKVECDTSHYEESEQFIKQAASSSEQEIHSDELLSPKQEQLDIMDACECNLEESDDSASLAVEVEPVVKFASYQAYVDTSKSEDTDNSMAQDNIPDTIIAVTPSTSRTSVDNESDPPKTITSRIINVRGDLSEKTKIIEAEKKTVTISLITCSKCDYQTDNQNYLKSHMAIHTSEKPYQCEECPYKCRRPSHLKRHMMLHTGERPFQCQECPQQYSVASNLKRHMMSHTGELPFQCQVCPYKSTQSNGLKAHMMKHTGQKPFQCDKCPYKSSQSSNLKTHMMKHMSEHPFQCDVCSYKCNKASSLKIHLMTHTGENPFHCKKCSYECRLETNLKRHMLIHTGEKRFECKECPYKCKMEANLRRHMFVHTGEKPFECKVCPYKCSTKSRLKIHELRHTVEKPFQCELCYYKCNRASCLKAHMIKHQ